jgi:hypothetical protein
MHAAGQVNGRLHRVLMLAPGIDHGLSEEHGKGQGTGNCRPLRFHASQERTSGTRTAPHLHGRLAHVVLEVTRIIDPIEQRDVTADIGNRRRGRLHPVDAEGIHLEFGKRPPHRIAVDYRQSCLNGDLDRRQRIPAADFRRDHVGSRLADVRLKCSQRAVHFVPLGHALDTDGRRADATSGRDHCVIAQLRQGHHWNFVAILQ